MIKSMQWYLLAESEGQTAASFNLQKVASALSQRDRAEARFLADECLSSNYADCD